MMPLAPEEMATEDELQILLNIFGDGQIEATYPFTNTPIFKARVEGESYRLTIACDKACLDRIARRRGRSPTRCRPSAMSSSASRRAA
jgi:hypothetical protein